MEDLLQQALDRRQQLRDELEAVERFIMQLQSIQTRQAPSPPERAQFQLWKPSPSRAEQVAAVRAMLDRAEEMILEEGRPLTRSELRRRLEAEGHALFGGDKNKVLGTNIWRSGRFWNIKGEGYWPRSQPIPHAYEGVPRLS